MKRTPLKRKTALKAKKGFDISKGWERKLSFPKKKVKKTQRAKKMELRKSIIKQYNLPNIKCSRYGTAKKPTRTDILMGMLWTVFAQYIRRRDAGKCISCGKYKTYEELSAGHYASAGGSDMELRFSDVNVNGECNTCNADFDGWHLVPMRKNLILKWGKTMIDLIDYQKGLQRSIKWDEDVFVEKINYYWKKINEKEN